MRKELILIWFLSLSNICAYGQSNDLQGYKIDSKYRILYVLEREDRLPSVTLNLIIMAEDVDSLKILTTVQAGYICNLVHTTAVYVVKAKLFTSFVTLSDIFAQYDIKADMQHFQIRIDNWIIDDPETILIEKGEIVKAEVTDEEKYKFINIITKHPIPKIEQ